MSELTTPNIPSPTPPWHRPVQSPNVETFTEDNDGDVLSLTMDVTYLNTNVLKTDPAAPYLAVLPDGNYLRQMKRIHIPKARETDTVPWKVTGTFVGFGWLVFNHIGRSAVLEWVGEAWTLIGGNAAPTD